MGIFSICLSSHFGVHFWVYETFDWDQNCIQKTNVKILLLFILSIHYLYPFTVFINFLLMLQCSYGPGRTATLRQSSYVSVAMENTMCAVQYFHTRNTIHKADTHLNSGWSTAETACEHSEFCKSVEAENTPKIFRSWLF